MPCANIGHAAAPSIGNGPFASQQSNTLTWKMVVRNYPDAIFPDVALLDSTHGLVIGRLGSTIPTGVIVLHMCFCLRYPPTDGAQLQ